MGVLREPEVRALRRAAGIVLAGGALVSVVPGRLPVVCPFRRLTGRPCPLCGMTTSVVRAIRLQPVQSVHAHPLGLPVALAAAGLVIARPDRLRVPAPGVLLAGVAGAWAVTLRRFARSRRPRGR
ncbi:MAG: DUF2752 domain-containing protein [Acidimicrobiales bacterium]